MKILILGASGMLGSTLHRIFSNDAKFEVWGSFRGMREPSFIESLSGINTLSSCDFLQQGKLASVMNKVNPQVVINCVGLIKQNPDSYDALQSAMINGLLPHQLAEICERMNVRLIHISTDCVFSGKKGMYTELDKPDATDIYGTTKRRGEVIDSRIALTLRTSMIGHELANHKSLLDWFLAQEGTVPGFSKAVFSGLTTVELARVIKKIILFYPSLSGLYHLSGKPIDKYSLLNLIAKIYKKNITIVEDKNIVIDRSLYSKKLKTLIDYQPPSWEKMLTELYAFNNNTSRAKAYVCK
ncbi:MAG: SDR family oxidoreductase [Pseudomonadota bacterium]